MEEPVKRPVEFTIPSQCPTLMFPSRKWKDSFDSSSGDKNPRKKRTRFSRTIMCAPRGIEAYIIWEPIYQHNRTHTAHDNTSPEGARMTSDEHREPLLDVVADAVAAYAHRKQQQLDLCSASFYSSAFRYCCCVATCRCCHTSRVFE